MITICATGPVVAYLNRNDPHPPWAVAVMKQARPPMLTCEPVLTEAVCCLRDNGLEVESLFEMLQRNALQLKSELSAHGLASKL